MDAFELPARTLFEVCVPVRQRKHKLRIDGDLSDWSASFVLPDLGTLEGTPNYATLYMAWDREGLYFALDVPHKKQVVVNAQQPHKGDALFLWIDTRDAREAVRAGRFCHEFVALPRPRGVKRTVQAWQIPIPRAREQAPLCDPQALHVASLLRQEGYSLELAIPRKCLNGYDPVDCSRLGFTYLVTDTTHGQQLWNVSPHLPFEHDPSTWATIELVE
ncbi:MAG: hypothetical protein ACUVX8_03865 [Candidatus Zipacnadales bacterium]